VLGQGSGLVHLKTTGRRTIPTAAQTQQVLPQVPQNTTHLSPPAQKSCCASAPLAASDNTGTAEQFMSFIKSANAPGALDAHTKQALAVALSVLSKCEPCLKMHIKKARTMGFSPGEIDEAAWMAIAFGGSPTMMFYNDIKKQLQ
jgi:AhpD family alkylhydroperoxidase